MQADVNRLVELRRQLDEEKRAYDERTEPLKAERYALQAKVTEELKKIGQFSARFENATVTRSVRKTLLILDEPLLVETLKKEGLSTYISERINEDWESAAKELAKEGRELAGTQLRETEFLSIRTTSEKDDNRKVVTE